MRVLMPGHGSLSVGGRLIDVSCDSPLTWYFVSHDRLVLLPLRLTLEFHYDAITDSYGTWFTVLWLLV